MAVIRRQHESPTTRLQGRTRACLSHSMLQYVLMALIVLYGLYFNHTTSSTTSLAVVEEHQPKRTHMPSNKEILRKLKPVDITYLDVTGGPDIQKREYHHRGAQDEHGQYGYKPKLQALRLDPPSLNLTSDALVKACNIRDEEYNMIHEKITIYQPEKEGDKKQQYETKLLCVLQTVGHRHDRMTALRQTWAPKCDGFFVASNVTDPSLGTVRIPHKDDTDLAKQKWSRLISIWSFIYDNYYQDYDWFYISNNDVVFLLVENLRLYLESAEIKVASRYGIEQERQSEYQVPLFLGKRVAYDGNYNDVFNAAGPGYVLNKAALKRLVLDGANKPLVEPTSKEDLMLARAFRRIGVYPYDTQDTTGGERFMVNTPGNHYANEAAPMHYWEHHSKQSASIRYGVDHCAENSISFHNVQTDLMTRLYALLYHKCPS